MRFASPHFNESLVAESPKDFEGIDINRFCLFLDLGDSKNILKILKTKENRNKFRLIIRSISLSRQNKDLFQKYSDHVAAMKFKGKPNSRILCHMCTPELQAKLHVTMAHGIIDKKSSEIKAVQRNLIKQIEKYTYTYYDEHKKALKAFEKAKLISKKGK